ncbi:DUF6146 family protein [Maribacter stanieri]|uniref:DUF6146 family protein n=1 Tax=Maribacter stanieri TaxID=440514 RepID=UPI0030DDAC4A|tara:strand:- start:126 stop:584 length:459 start_codon:yes stop_codon:yes gene_type:complete
MKKNTFYSLLILSVTTLLFINCSTTKDSLSITESEEKTFKQVQEDTITISSEKTEYEIIIIEPGFTTWLSSIAKPEGYYSQNFLENRNNIMVLEWNNRVLQPSRFNPNLYELRIDYSQQIDYGYEVNYKLYNYFIYFQRKYNQRLGPFVPRI